MQARPLIHTAKQLDEAIDLDYDTVLDALHCGEIDSEYGLMRWGSNYTFLVAVHHDDLTFMGIYKPRMGERPLWDFPDGTLCQRETASYVLSDMLGWYIVPPTVLRDGPRGIGSIQVFIDHDPNLHYFTFDDRDDLQPQLMRMALFDALINNADRKGGHCLLDPYGHLWGIDHGLAFNAVQKLRTVIWDYAGQPIPDDLKADLQTLCDQLDNPTDEHTQRLRDLMNDMEFHAFHTRVKRLLLSGEYPQPGPGPNRPWPAV